jgi:hypothetical protein
MQPLSASETVSDNTNMPLFHRRRKTSRALSNNVLVHPSFTGLLILQLLTWQFGSDCMIITAIDPVVTSSYRPSLVEFDTELWNQERLDRPQRVSKLRRPKLVSPFISPNSPTTFEQSEVMTLRQRRTQQATECSAYPACADAGLVNDCCPTAQGVVLGCCSITSSPGTFGYVFFSITNCSWLNCRIDLIL